MCAATAAAIWSAEVEVVGRQRRDTLEEQGPARRSRSHRDREPLGQRQRACRARRRSRSRASNVAARARACGTARGPCEIVEESTLPSPDRRPAVDRAAPWPSSPRSGSGRRSCCRCPAPTRRRRRAMRAPPTAARRHASTGEQSTDGLASSSRSLKREARAPLVDPEPDQDQRQYDQMAGADQEPLEVEIRGRPHVDSPTIR